MNVRLGCSTPGFDQDTTEIMFGWNCISGPNSLFVLLHFGCFVVTGIDFVDCRLLGFMLQQDRHDINIITVFVLTGRPDLMTNNQKMY